MCDNLPCGLLRIRDLELDVRHRDAVPKVCPVGLQVVDHRSHEVRELIASAELQGGQIRQPSDVVDEAVHVQLHLEGGVPVFEGEHRAPQAPEVRVQDIIGENVLDGLVLQGLIGHQHEVRELHRCLLAEVELAVVVSLSAVRGDAALGEVRVVLVDVIEVIEHRDVRILDRGKRVEQIPEDLEVMAHLTAAPCDVTDVFDDLAVKAPAWKIELFQIRDLRAVHVGVPDQEAAGCKVCDAGADHVGLLVVDALRLSRLHQGVAVACIEFESRILRFDVVIHGKPPRFCFPLPDSP